MIGDRIRAFLTAAFRKVDPDGLPPAQASQYGAELYGNRTLPPFSGYPTPAPYGPRYRAPVRQMGQTFTTIGTVSPWVLPSQVPAPRPTYTTIGVVSPYDPMANFQAQQRNVPAHRGIGDPGSVQIPRSAFEAPMPEFHNQILRPRRRGI